VCVDDIGGATGCEQPPHVRRVDTIEVRSFGDLSAKFGLHD